MSFWCWEEGDPDMRAWGFPHEVIWMASGKLSGKTVLDTCIFSRWLRFPCLWSIVWDGQMIISELLSDLCKSGSCKGNFWAPKVELYGVPKVTPFKTTDDRYVIPFFGASARNNGIGKSWWNEDFMKGILIITLFTQKLRQFSQN